MKLAVIGDPVAHSASPRLHEGFLADADIDGSYVAIRIAQGDGAAAVRRLHGEGYTGCNVTYPLKEETLAACARLTEEAERAQAVNTIFFGREILGANTDGIGARSAIEALLDEPIALKRIGILGYGATARAILAELQKNDAYTFVWGRDARRVGDTCRRFEAKPWPDGNPPEIVLSTLPPDVELSDRLVAELQVPDVVIDANYGPRTTLARRLRRDVVTGDAMLEAQARASFDFWLAHLDAVGGLP
jgi:shikimate dehydrogenase